MGITRDISSAEIYHLYHSARSNFKQAVNSGVRNPEGIALLADSGTIIWGGSYNEDGLTAADDIRGIHATLSPHEQFVMATIVTPYDRQTGRNAPASDDTLVALRQISGRPLFVKIIAPEDKGTQAFILS